MRPHLLGLLGDALRRVGELEQSAVTLEAALGWAERNGERWAVPEIHAFSAELESARGDLDAMRAAAERAAHVARETGAVGFARRAAVMLQQLSPVNPE